MSRHFLRSSEGAYAAQSATGSAIIQYLFDQIPSHAEIFRVVIPVGVLAPQHDEMFTQIFRLPWQFQMSLDVGAIHRACRTVSAKLHPESHIVDFQNSRCVDLHCVVGRQSNAHVD